MKRVIQFLMNKKYATIGGQAVLDGVMMRSPNAFVVAVRKPDQTIRLRRDQWFGLGNRFKFFRKPFMRGVLVLIESMANGIVSLNYSANIAMKEEMKEKALKKGKSIDEFEEEQKKKEKVNWATFVSMGVSVILGIGLFMFGPHYLTLLLAKLLKVNWGLDSFMFHAVDGLIKSFIFVLYIFCIGFLPDIKRVFQYHGAEHKSIATFEAGEELVVENAKKHSILHPRCGTSFVFFLLFISIIIFSIIFVLVPVGQGYPYLLKHLVAVMFKVILIIPVAGLSYEVIKFAGSHAANPICKGLSFPGMLLQRLTTAAPDDSQLEVALSSIKAVLMLEEKYNLKTANAKILTLEEVDITDIGNLGNPNSRLKDFLE